MEDEAKYEELDALLEPRGRGQGQEDSGPPPLDRLGRRLELEFCLAWTQQPCLASPNILFQTPL